MILNLFHAAFSTDYQFIQYRVEDGLKTDIIKSIERDSLGFIWIGSDEGLMQYNGNEFLHYPYATETPFIKQLLRLKDGRLLVLNDLGLDEINNQIDTVIFRSVLPGTRVPTDSSLWYPKSCFEDSRGNIWIGEPQSVVRFTGDALNRIEYGPEDNSSSFVRSFSFAELPDGRILISSFTGNFSTFHNDTGAFVFLEKGDFVGEINHMIFWNGHVYLGCTSGVYRSYKIGENTISFEKILEHENIAHLLPISEQELLISSFTGKSLIYNKQQNIYSELPYNLTVVNRAYKSITGNLWLATEKGVVLMKPQIFSKIKTDSENIYVESIALSDDKSKVYFSSKEHIRVFKPGAVRSEIFDIKRQGYFLSLQYMDNKLWASNGTDIYLYSTDGKILSTWDFADYGRFIFDIVIDKQKNVWFTQEASQGLKMISSDGKVKFFDQEQGIKNELTIVRLGKDGIYTGSNDPSAYLYFKSYQDTIFKNISKKVNFNFQGGFRIEDIAVDEDVIWLASSIGLLRQTENSLDKISLDQKLSNLLVKAVKIQEGSEFIWFNNAYGLIQYNTQTGEYNIYDESHGLPSNTINTRAISINKDGIWLGTASGLAFSDYDFSALEKTPMPYIVKFSADNKVLRPSSLSLEKLPSNAFVEMIVSSPAYPSTKLRYQYKMDSEKIWKEIPEGNMLAFSKLNSGDYSISFRSKIVGNYTWSDSNTYDFSVKKAYYETWYFMVLVIVVMILLIIITRFISVRILMKRQQELEKLVTERTIELERANADLLERNRELDQFVYSTSHDLSAPLKSIRGLINIANYEHDINAQKSLLGRMNESVIKLETFIRDVISYSRNARLDVKKTDINLKGLIHEILDHISNLDNFHKINFDISVDEDVFIASDETRVKIILNNLLSNAVKFQRFDEEQLPRVHVSYRYENAKHHIKVSDNGHGISEEYQDKIFNMFYRANATSDGSGLGLYILKETLRKLEGDVEVKSKEGVGSEFIVSFP